MKASSARFLEDMGLPTPRNFAYPYGDISVSSKRRCGAAFRSARGITPGLNAGIVDLAQVRAYPLEARSYDEREVGDAIDAAAAAPTWLVFFSHDVSDAPSPYGCTPAMLRFVLDRLKAHAIPAVTVDEALDRAGL